MNYHIHEDSKVYVRPARGSVQIISAIKVSEILESPKTFADNYMILTNDGFKMIESVEKISVSPVEFSYRTLKRGKCSIKLTLNTFVRDITTNTDIRLTEAITEGQNVSEFMCYDSSIYSCRGLEVKKELGTFIEYKNLLEVETLAKVKLVSQENIYLAVDNLFIKG